MMLGRIAIAPCIPFHATCSFSGHHVGISAPDTRVLDGFVHIKRRMVSGSSLHDFPIMTYVVLPMMVVSAGQSSGISGLHAVNPHVGIPLVCFIQLPLVIENITSGFVMPDNLNAFFTGVAGYLFDIEVCIRLGVVERLRAAPVLPTFIPSLVHHGFYIVGGGKVNVTLGVFSSRTVSVVNHPTLHAKMHPPPDTYVLHRSYPIRSFQRTRLIQVQYKSRIDQPYRLRCYL